MEHFSDALEYFRRAEELYRDIGDEVSYAWTLWSFGTALKVLRRFDEAREKFEAARALFAKTGDARGMVYYLLAVAEIAFLEGHKEEAFALFERIETSLSGKPLKLEKVHLRLYRWLAGKEEASLDDIRELYRKLGVHFLPPFPVFPLNLP